MHHLMSLKVARAGRLSCEICILAGGLSQRMGRDKGRLRLGRRTMLGVIRAAAKATGLPVRVVRRDCVPRCGPLGGVYTVLKRGRAQAILFLACDMPFVSQELLQTLVAGAQERPTQARFVRTKGMAGFPFLLGEGALPIVAAQISRGELSVQALAKALEAKVLALPRRFAPQLRNLNTPEEWAQALKDLQPR